MVQVCKYIHKYMYIYEYLPVGTWYMYLLQY